jgi:hypothetical protein
VTQPPRWRSCGGWSSAHKQVGASRIRAGSAAAWATTKTSVSSTTTSAQPWQTGHPLPPSRHLSEPLPGAGGSASRQAAGCSSRPSAVGLPLTSADQPSCGGLTFRSECRYRTASATRPPMPAWLLCLAGGNPDLAQGAAAKGRQRTRASRTVNRVDGFHDSPGVAVGAAPIVGDVSRLTPSDGHPLGLVISPKRV